MVMENNMEWLGGYCHEFCMNNDTLVFRMDFEVYSISFRLLDNEAFWSVWFSCRLRDGKDDSFIVYIYICVYFFSDNNVVLHLHCYDGRALWADVKLFLTVDCHFTLRFLFCFVSLVTVSIDCFVINCWLSLLLRVVFFFCCFILCVLLLLVMIVVLAQSSTIAKDIWWT